MSEQPCLSRVGQALELCVCLEKPAAFVGFGESVDLNR